MKNEKTSKIVASKASEILDDADSLIAELARAQKFISKTIVLLEKAKSVAGSCLTQSPDKKEK